MALRHRAKYINGQLKFKDREKFTKELETFKGEPFDIVLSKEVTVDRDYLRRYYFAVIVDAYGNEVGLEKDEAHSSLKQFYGFKEQEEVKGVSKLDAETLQNAIDMTCSMLSKFAKATNIEVIKANNKVFIEYVRGYSTYTEKELLEYHKRCRDGLFKELTLSIPKETEVSV